MSLTGTRIKLRVNGSWMDFRNALHSRQPFDAGAMRGGVGSLYGRAEQPSGYAGRLDGDWHRTFQARRGLIDYVVCSYYTPIAWHDKETGWVMPDEKYSATTPKHQGKIRAAVRMLSE